MYELRRSEVLPDKLSTTTQRISFRPQRETMMPMLMIGFLQISKISPGQIDVDTLFKRFDPGKRLTITTSKRLNMMHCLFQRKCFRVMASPTQVICGLLHEGAEKFPGRPTGTGVILFSF